jgi:hypothetical protein
MKIKLKSTGLALIAVILVGFLAACGAKQTTNGSQSTAQASTQPTQAIAEPSTKDKIVEKNNILKKRLLKLEQR